MKKSYSEEIRRAEAALTATNDTAIWQEPGRVIALGINNMVAGFSVSIAMIGLLPTALYYYADKEKRRKVLELIAKMSNTTAIDMIGNIRAHPDDKTIRQQIVDDAIGLKYIIRTYQQE